MEKYDLIVIGSGPGGYVAALKAASLGLKTVVIEKGNIGGVCLNIGCIPSKSLIHQASIFSQTKELKAMGIEVDTSGFDFEKVHKKSRLAADKLSKGIEFLFKKNSVDFIAAEGVISGKNRVTLSTGDKLEGKHILVATGAHARSLPGFTIDEDKILSSTGVLMLKELPESIAILGSGAIGCEFAHIFNAFGVQVHLIEMLDHILPSEDEEVTSVLERSFKKRRIKLYTKTKASSYVEKEGRLVIQTENREGKQKEIVADKIVVAIGRVPNTENIGLENVSIQTEKGTIPVGPYYQTSCDSVYAIGDVISSPQLAHVASREGEIAVMHMAGKECESVIDNTLIPGAVYCEPQVAGFGKSESSLIKAGIEYEKSVFPYKGAGKTTAIEKTEGLVKVLYAPDKTILGAFIIGEQASELIHEILVAKQAGLTAEAIGSTIHAHPTISEAVMEAMKGVSGGAIHS